MGIDNINSKTSIDQSEPNRLRHTCAHQANGIQGREKKSTHQTLSLPQILSIVAVFRCEKLAKNEDEKHCSTFFYVINIVLP